MLNEAEVTHSLTPTCKVLLAGLPHPAWTCLPEGPCNHLSERWVEYTGVPEEKHLGFGWLEAVHPEDRDRVVNEWTAQAKLEERFDTQFRIRRHDGVYHSFQTSACPIKNASGELLYWLGTNTDVQDLLDAESELAEANRRLERRASALKLSHAQRLLQQFVKHAPAAIAMMDKELRYIEVSDRWIQDYQLQNLDNIIGLSHYDVFPDIPERWKEIHQRVLQGHVEKMEEDPFPREDGSVVWLQWECQPWYTEYNEVGGAIFFTKVITHQKEMELELLRQKQALQRSNSDLEHFARAASHDLQTPLRAVSSCVTLLQSLLQEDGREDVEELLSHIYTGVTRMRELVRSILSFSTLDQQVELESVDLEAALGEVLSDHRQALSEGQLKLDIPELPTVHGAYSLLVQLFQNLVGNAVKYGGTEVRISVADESEYWKIGVHDNGIGIDPAYKDSIFEIFKRLHSYSQYSGSGIGLASCRRIVSIHQGKIWVESEPNQGSSFYFTLPKEGYASA